MTTAATEDRRYGPRERQDALCCECGAVRSIASGRCYPKEKTFDPVETGSEASARLIARGYRAEPGWHSLREARCAVCRKVTRHAAVRNEASWPCMAEEKLEEQRVARNGVARLVRWMALDGIDVRWVSGDDFDNEGHLVCLLQYRDASRSWFLVELREGARPQDLLRSIQLAEEYLDDPERLGEWNTDEGGDGWRGYAFR